MILTAYYDESGTHDGSPVTVLAGFVGSTGDWIKFECEWRKVLKKHGVTHIRAKQLWHRQGPYKGWTTQRAWLLWADLLYVLQENKKIIASKTILKEEDYAIFYWSDGPAPKERLDTRYALCFRSLMHFHPVFHRDRYVAGSANIVLEAGHRNWNDAVRVFSELKNDKEIPWRENMGSVSFISKQDSPALQAADMLAYWSYRSAFNNCRYHEEGHISRFELEILFSGLTTVDHLIRPEDLTTLRQNFLRKKKKPVFGLSRLDYGPLIVEPSSVRVGERPHEPIYQMQLRFHRRRSAARFQ